jgi:hypothetical protein
MRFIVVKRSALWTFRCLEQSCKDIADLRVIWDRRRGQDRRSDGEDVATERRAEDRRRAAPLSWTAAGHLLATPPSDGSSPEQDRLVGAEAPQYREKLNA